MSDIPTPPKPESTSVKNKEDSPGENPEDESGGDTDNNFAEASRVGSDAAASASSSSSPSSLPSKKRKRETYTITAQDRKTLPPPPKGISTIAKPYYYAFEKVKVQREDIQSQLNQLRQETLQAKQKYDLLCIKLSQKEVELSQVEDNMNTRSEDFFEARLDEPNDWNVMYKQLRAYREENGDFLLEKDDNPALEELKVWVKKQRDSKKKGCMKPFKEAALERLGFPWAPKDDFWNEKYNELLAYKATHGHVLVDKDENPDLANWVKQQQNNLMKRYRISHNTRAITPKREQLLIDIGLKQKYVAETKWEINYDLALKYKAKHGKFPPRKDPLGGWLIRQRDQYYNHKEGKKCKLSLERLAKLEKLEVEDSPRKSDMWKERFDELVRYKNEHGCFPSIQNWRKRTPLGSWISSQRSHYKYLNEGMKSILTPERVKMLNDIGFQWSLASDIPKKSWHERYEELVTFYIENGHCRVSIADKANFQLADWVKRQRRNYWDRKDGKVTNGPMTEERIRMLEALDFSWQVRSRRSGPDKKQPSTT